MSSRARETNSPCASDLGSSLRSWAGEGRARVSTTLMSDVFCMKGKPSQNPELAGKHRNAPRGSDCLNGNLSRWSLAVMHSEADYFDRIPASKNKLAGRLPLSDRPFAFLVTPKL